MNLVTKHVLLLHCESGLSTILIVPDDCKSIAVLDVSLSLPLSVTLCIYKMDHFVAK